MKTYYDGEEREIVSITPYYWDSGKRSAVFRVVYKRGESVGELLVVAEDEIEVYQKFPDELARCSILHTDED
jgi:hypothetical protein